MTITRRQAITGLALGAGSATLPAPALAQSRIEWRMVTSWPKNLPGPGVTAQRLADAITTMSAGRLTVKLFGAGEIVPALQVFDAVQEATVEMAHTASLFWSGKMAAAPMFTAAPFGLTPLEHITWIDHGGGQALWDELYAPSGIKPFMAGNTGFQMGGWFRDEIASLDDIKGLKIRMPGLGGRVMRKLGAQPVTTAPGDIFTSLQTGVIDAAEFLGPFSDSAMAFHQATKNYYGPGWHEPNGTGEALVSRPAFEALPEDLRQIVVHACRSVNIEALGESEWQNAEALRNLVERHGVRVLAFPADVIDAARKATVEVLDELAATDAITGRIVDSYRNAARHQDEWSSTSVKAFLAARAGS